MNNHENITTIFGSPDDLNTWIYQLNDTGMYVRETEIESVKPTDKPTTIIQITDVHLNYVNKDDENDEEVMYTKQCRVWNKDGASVKALNTAMEYAKDYDQTIITGDILDYLSCGAKELMEKYIWQKNPNVLCAVGGHDLTKQMQTKRPNKLSIEERYAIVQKDWKHDVKYTSKVINDNVLAIVLDNSHGKYFDCQVEPFKKDIALAREKGYTVLIFEHEPISTLRPEDENYRSFYVWFDCGEEDDFYKVTGYNPDEPTKEIYDTIVSNADIIRGIFCGHYHTSHYIEIDGTYKDENGKIIPKKIPQYLLECNVYDNYEGHVMKITVK
ncbi:MAG: hypothetical protein IJQ50_06335 [Clostridia bacterium]|nr:hypothetical protein [Clostridia bacterium]